MAGPSGTRGSTRVAISGFESLPQGTRSRNGGSGACWRTEAAGIAGDRGCPRSSVHLQPRVERRPSGRAVCGRGSFGGCEEWTSCLCLSSCPPGGGDEAGEARWARVLLSGTQALASRLVLLALCHPALSSFRKTGLPSSCSLAHPPILASLAPLFCPLATLAALPLPRWQKIQFS